MAKLQELLATLLPDAWAASLEAESRSWRMRCPCGAETNIWDMGGIRWQGFGSPRRKGICGACGRQFAGSLYQSEPARPVAPRRNPEVAATIADVSDRPSRPSEAVRGAYLLWIDGVGCWQMHINERFCIGGPGSSGRGEPGADLKLLADLSRSHASLVRFGESYIFSSDGPATLSGNPASQPTVLRDGALIGLGNSVRLRFRQPNALSLTVRLEFDSEHRPALRIDGVLLMDQACILGPSEDCHVVCHEWPRRIIVFRRDGKLWCKLGAAADPSNNGEADDLYVNGCRVENSAPLRDGTIVTLEDARFRIEMPAAECHTGFV